MTIKRLLVANRGEIAVRIIRAAADLGIGTVAVYSEDDAGGLHVRRSDEARALSGRGPAAYLDTGQIIAVATDAGCDAIHPGYGFLSESAMFARGSADAGLVFIGPRPDVLELFGDKARARAFAADLGVPVLAGTPGGLTLEDANVFLASLGEGAAMMLKAVAGGGGRGMRMVRQDGEVAEAYERCQSEALAAFGNGDLYAERAIPRARHVEVQIIGDSQGNVSHVGERDCTIQRRHQKLIEITPAFGLDPAIRERIIAAASSMAEATRFDNIGTFEFLVDTESREAPFVFIEANARLQVEHTVTEEATGIDLVATQLRLAGGETLADLRLRQQDLGPPRGAAIQVRINAETYDAAGAPHPTGGHLSVFEPPSGSGVRVDSAAYAGCETNPAFDSLLAKLIVRAPQADLVDLLLRAYRALCEFRIEGVATNIGVLQSLVQHPDVQANRAYTRFFEEHAADLVAADTVHRQLFFPAPAAGDDSAEALAGARVDPTDPLAVLRHGKSGGPAPRRAGTAEVALSDSAIAVRAPIQGTIIAIGAEEGDLVRGGQTLFVMEALKMEHVVAAETGGRLRALAVAVGDTVFAGHTLAVIEPAAVDVDAEDESAGSEPEAIRPDLAEALQRHEIGLDAARPDAVERRRKTNQRTARENIEDLCDEGSFVEYGPLVIAAQRRRRPVQELIERTPADGLVAGIGAVNGDLFDEAHARCIAMSYDYTVLAGTQGQQNHRKKDRMFELAEKWRLPIIFFTEGGGGRPGDTDGVGVAGLDCMAFNYFGKLSGLVPLVGVVSGRCFAGNAALLGCCDVVIATQDANIGMGGPAMIEGGGLGVFRPEEVGPTDVQSPNGVIDVLVEDEAHAVRVAKQYLSYFQGMRGDWSCADQRALRRAIPENRRRVYDVRSVIETLADTGSVLELRRHFGLGMVTALVRIEGRVLGIIANNPMHLSGAIDSDGADKAARFMQLCDAFDLPLLNLCDTPGIMVGPEVEQTALVRHAARMFVTGASVTVPVFTIILRKAYGLGAQAMAGGSFKAPFFTVSWPTGEFGGMGLEGAVKLGYRNELEAIDDPAKRKATFDQMVERMYQHGKAVNTASHFEIDDVIDPVDSRRWVISALKSLPSPVPRTGKKRPSIDTW
jgi:acetyl/propionyl-CoA carboxylase alpha subunit/acetyl-CoA carboxylase carboxyltransferase component